MLRQRHHLLALLALLISSLLAAPLVAQDAGLGSGMLDQAKLKALPSLQATFPSHDLTRESMESWDTLPHTNLPGGASMGTMGNFTFFSGTNIQAKYPSTKDSDYALCGFLALGLWHEYFHLPTVPGSGGASGGGGGAPKEGPNVPEMGCLHKALHLCTAQKACEMAEQAIVDCLVNPEACDLWFALCKYYEGQMSKCGSQEAWDATQQCIADGETLPECPFPRSQPPLPECVWCSL
ncbi:MAG: hypothetical protein AAF682_18460 [Planctomycetota bacterium]